MWLKHIIGANNDLTYWNELNRHIMCIREALSSKFDYEIHLKQIKNN